jgi:hypothetical protein
MLKGRNKQVYLALKQKASQGLTVIEAMQLGLGTELRKNVTTLIRKGYNIEKHPEYKLGRHWIRYVLVEQPQREKEPEIDFKREALEGKALEKWQQTRTLFK